MGTSSRSYKGHAYNAEDARLTADLRMREADRRIASAALMKRRGQLGPEQQIIALCDWVKILHAEGKTDAARNLTRAIRKMMQTVAQ